MLTANYVDEMYWWEGVVVLNKLVFVMVVDLTSKYERHLRAFLAEIVLLVGIILEQVFQPRKPEMRPIYFL
jgi:hypothetical protein